MTSNKYSLSLLFSIKTVYYESVKRVDEWAMIFAKYVGQHNSNQHENRQRQR